MQQRLELKHQNQLEDLQRKNALAVRELEHIQVSSSFYRVVTSVEHENMFMSLIHDSFWFVAVNFRAWKHVLVDYLRLVIV